MDAKRLSVLLNFGLQLHLYSTLLPQAAGRQQTDCVGTHHGNLTPPRISPSCPHCLIPVSPGAVAGQEYHYQIADEGRAGRNQPQCETARHRLLCGRMGTALHLPWPSLMRFPAQVVLAHPPVSLQPSSRRTSRQRTYPAAGYEVFKEQKEDGFLPIFPVQGKLGQNTVHHLKIIAN